MPKFRYSLDSGSSWMVVDSTLPYNIPSVGGDTVIVEPIGAAVTAAAAVNPDVTLGEALLDEAVIFVDWQDAANYANVYARNQNDTRDHTANLIAFPTGLTVNESGSANPPRTLQYANGPDGLPNATRVLTTAANQIWYVMRTVVNGALPAGSYTFRFRARSLTASAWAMTFGQAFGGSGSAPVASDWSDTLGTTFSHTFTANGTSGDIAIRFTNSGSDVLIDHLELYPTASLPASFGADGFAAGGRRGAAYLTLDGNNNMTVGTHGAVLLDPLFPAKRALTAYTMLTVQNVTSIPAGAAHMLNQHPGDGGSTTGNSLQVESSPNYAGELIANSGGVSSRQGHALNVAGKGIFMFGQTQDATTRRVFFGGTQVLEEPRSFTGMNVARWEVGGHNTTSISAVNLNMCPGAYVANLVWERALTAQEMRYVASAWAARTAARSLALAAADGQIVFSGMSNTQKGTGDWTQYISQNAWISPTRNLLQTNTSVGGQGVDALERDSTGAEIGLAEGTITANGRFWKRDAPALLGAAMAGPVGYAPDLVVNDWDQFNATSPAAVAARYQALFTLAEALDPNVYSIVTYPIPQSTSNAGREDFEADRHAFMVEMEAWIALAPAKRFKWGVGELATVGDLANIGTHLQGDGIHLIPGVANVGDDAVADDFALFCADWWTSIGVS